MPKFPGSRSQLHNSTILNFRRIFVILFTLAFAIYSDQYTKVIAEKYLSDLEPISFYSNILVFSYVENSGGFLGIVMDLPAIIQFILLNICVTIILSYCLYYLFFKNNPSILQTITLAVITGGGISNLVDRITNNGGVIDFIQVGIDPLKTGIFNLADMYILGGSFLLGFLLLKNHH